MKSVVTIAVAKAKTVWAFVHYGWLVVVAEAGFLNRPRKLWVTTVAAVRAMPMMITAIACVLPFELGYLLLAIYDLAYVVFQMSVIGKD